MFSSSLCWDRALYLLQKEVAERLTAKQGDEAYGTLSVIARLGGDISIVRLVPREVFWPKPEVESALVSCRFKPLEERMQVPWERVKKITQAAFTGRRKRLANALKNIIPANTVHTFLEENRLSVDSTRAEDCSPELFLSLAQYLLI